MAEPRLHMEEEEGLDDLPRTLRREHEARQREAREREGPSFAASAYETAGSAYAAGDPTGDYGAYPSAPLPASVQRIDVPFVRLMLFFLKAVIAAIPALVLLGAILWLVGDLLQAYFPWIIKMKIEISFPG